MSLLNTAIPTSDIFTIGENLHIINQHILHIVYFMVYMYNKYVNFFFFQDSLLISAEENITFIFQNETNEQNIKTN